MAMTLDHLVVGAADLDTGIRWVEERTGAAPVFGGVHAGVGTRNALLGLGEPYLEVLAVDPDQSGVSSPIREQVAGLHTPALITVAVAKSDLTDPIPMTRVRPDGVRLEWALEFTDTPLFFIDWKDTPRPADLPDGGRLTSLVITTPDPARLSGLTGTEVRQGEWKVEATINGVRL